MSTTLIRVFSAAAFLFVAAIVIYFFKLDGFKGLALVAILLIQTEYVQLVFKDFSFGTRFFIAIVYFIVFFDITFLTQYDLFWQSITLAGIMSSFLLMVRLKSMSQAEQLKYQGLFYLGLFYVGLLPCLILLILNLKYGLWVLFCNMVIVFMGDIFAYFIGRRWGKKKLSPAISPNKSWAGAWGGLAGSLIFGLFLLFLAYQPQFGMLPQSPLVTVSFLICCVLGSVTAQIGDFFESLIKRSVNEKDSGKILPGHGGMLDRFDALIFSVPIFFWFAKLINHL